MRQRRSIHRFALAWLVALALGAVACGVFALALLKAEGL